MGAKRRSAPFRGALRGFAANAPYPPFAILATSA
jgi:hypothetical protein